MALLATNKWSVISKASHATCNVDEHWTRPTACTNTSACANLVLRSVLGPSGCTMEGTRASSNSSHELVGAATIVDFEMCCAASTCSAFGRRWVHLAWVKPMVAIVNSDAQTCLAFQHGGLSGSHVVNGVAGWSYSRRTPSAHAALRPQTPRPRGATAEGHMCDIAKGSDAFHMAPLRHTTTEINRHAITIAGGRSKASLLLFVPHSHDRLAVLVWVPVRPLRVQPSEATHNS